MNRFDITLKSILQLQFLGGVLADQMGLTIREWISNEPFVLSIGNAGGVTLELNGRLLPPLGPSGTVIARLVVPEGP